MNDRPAVDPRSLVRPAFRREFTPTWLCTAAVLAGQRPPDEDEPLRVLDMRCRSGITAAVIAAAHPDAEVWAMDPEPTNVERADRLASGAQLKNLTVLEAPASAGVGELPDSVDVLLLDDVVSTTDDAGRDALAVIVARRVRAGGLIAVAYRTKVVWSEVAPVRRLALLLAARGGGDRLDQQAAIVELLQRLKSAGARYLLDRPMISELVDRAGEIEPDDLADVLMVEHLEPMALADVADWLAPTGATFIGSAGLDDVDSDSPLVELLRDTQDTRLREALRDLAFRPAFRIDLFRRGTATLPVDVRTSLLMELELVGLGMSNPTEDAPQAMVPGALVERIGVEATRVGDLIDGAPRDAAEADRLVRVLLHNGLAHPRASGWGARVADSSCFSLNQHLPHVDPRHAGLLASPVIGSAVAGPPDERHEPLGITTARPA